jgi:hypothetical protein
VAWRASPCRVPADHASALVLKVVATWRATVVDTLAAALMGDSALIEVIPDDGLRAHHARPVRLDASLHDEIRYRREGR